MTTGIQVYGTDWCRLTFGIREYLTNSRVDYEYFDIDRDQQADELVRTRSQGRRRYPLVVLAGHFVTNPTITALAKLLRDHRVEPRPGRANTRRTGDREGSRRA
jgi:glutaredoxin